MNINQMSIDSGRMMREDSSIINAANAYKQIKDGVATHVTSDSFRAAIMDGNAYKMSFADPTGISQATSYIYYIKNTGEKDIWLRTIDFNPGTFLLQIVKGGIFKIAGTEYDMEDYIDISAEGTLTADINLIAGTFDTSYIKAGMQITGNGIPDMTFIAAITNNQITMSNNATATATVALTIGLPTLLARNLNTNSINKATLKAYFQNAAILGGAVTWGDTDANKLLKTIEYEMATPSMLGETMSILSSGTTFVAVLTNYGTAKMPYRISVEWAEV